MTVMVKTFILLSVIDRLLHGNPGARDNSDSEKYVGGD